jgi:transcriptional regulator with XRE-family HTH domain
MDHKTPGEIFGMRLRARRMECHLTQAALARKLGAGKNLQNYVSRWESGSVEYMTLGRLMQLAGLLHTTTDYLLGLSNSPGGLVPLEEETDRESGSVASAVDVTSI